ncbi:MAG: F0F1 ATP synthase subunit A [Planctomycetia bacterium]|nr:F0F1 ATP synthase subunit A [Planctomycetia bacterium]
MRWIGLLAALFLLLALVPDAGLAADPHAGHAHDAKDKDAQHDAHHVHEPSPAHEVMDQHDWHIFHNSKFSLIIPLGWFEFGPYQIFGKDVIFRIPTRFMVVELLSAILISLLFIGLAKRVKDGEPVRGRLWNALEALILFIRDDVVRPNLDSKHHGHEHDAHHGDAHHAAGHHAPAKAPAHPLHDGDRYLPYIWTAFLFILALNLFGLIPFMGSPTGNICVTGALAICSFFLLHVSAIGKMGFQGYLGSMWMNIDIPPMFGFGTLLSYAIKIMIFFLEFFGTFIKSFVLAVRLFANVFAGHMVVASVLFFIFMTRHAHDAIWATVTFASVVGVIAISLLELFVAFLQAYIFVFLTALFTGMATNPEH